MARIAEIISESQTMRVELVGFSVPADALTPERAQRLGERRAIAAMDQLRSYGPSRRRFLARAAHVDEESPAGLVEASGDIFQPVILRVTQR
ncbi:MAG: hypothetical protein GY720_08560 [bacterium]|nr:hypothetical protein [bacterium]